MKTYDPDQTPNPEQWMEWDEADRLDLVMTYHQSADIELPNTRIHAAFHTIVENQLAEGLAEHVQGILQESSSGGKDTQAYFRGLEKLTAGKWLASGQ